MVMKKDNRRNEDRIARNVTGQKIRAIRVAKKITVKELSKACGVNENTIRNWEIGIRQVSEDKLELLAERLEVPTSALRDRHIDNITDALYALLELSEKFKLSPILLPQIHSCLLMTSNDELMAGIDIWHQKRQLNSYEELEKWMYSIDDEEHDGKTEYSKGLESFVNNDYSDKVKIIFLKKALADSLYIFKSQLEMIIYNIKNSSKENQGLAIKQLETLDKTLEITIKKDLEKY